MKRLFSLAMIIAIVLSSVALTASASDNAFISSPSAVPAPVLVEYETSEDVCEAELIICAYADRGQLSDSSRATLEEAYASIVSAEDVLDICPELAEAGFSSGVLAVSDLFEIYYTNCDNHNGHSVTITLRPRVTENFAAVLHYVDGTWENVDNAKVEKNGTDITFEVDSLSPFAIALHDGSVQPATSNMALVLSLLCLVLLIIIIVIIIVISKKKKSEEQ